MSSDQPDSPSRSRPWYQFSLRTMVLVTVYFAVLGKVCTVLHHYRLKDAPGWLAVFLYAWTAVILAQLALTISARWQLRKWWATAEPTDLLDDPLKRVRSKERRWRFRIALAWGMVPLVLWMAFLPTLGRRDGDWLAVFCIILLHFLPLLLIDAVRYLVRRRRQDPGPVQAMRLAGIAGFMFPAAVLTSAWVLGMW